ncbi:hypothetical protein VQ7734_01300 [Vibrio quintilis]|uniref:Uncharacterized protein n=2 Tax=Vibrio quintilis TaxID=1117707 RepID=A0A1M7YSG8_9VIBR|nr:hypothetical protein VQ7734_01300 [Vibrio quintilis]
MTLLELNLRVAITAVLLTLVLNAVVPRLILCSEQQQILSDVKQLSDASVNEIKLASLQSTCPENLSDITVNKLVSEGLLTEDWSEKTAEYSVRVSRKTIHTTSSTTYTKPALVTVQYHFSSIQTAKPFYEIADSHAGKNLFFTRTITRNDMSQNSYVNSKTGCATL